jgi:hypothetical protein
MYNAITSFKRKYICYLIFKKLKNKPEERRRREGFGRGRVGKQQDPVPQDFKICCMMIRFVSSLRLI